MVQKNSYNQCLHYPEPLPIYQQHWMHWSFDPWTSSDTWSSTPPPPRTLYLCPYPPWHHYTTATTPHSQKKPLNHQKSNSKPNKESNTKTPKLLRDETHKRWNPKTSHKAKRNGLRWGRLASLNQAPSLFQKSGGKKNREWERESRKKFSSLMPQWSQSLYLRNMFFWNLTNMWTQKLH